RIASDELAIGGEVNYALGFSRSCRIDHRIPKQRRQSGKHDREPSQPFHGVSPPASSRGPDSTIFIRSDGKGLAKASASSVEPLSQMSISSPVSITGIASAWMGLVSALASVVRMAKSRCVPSSLPRMPLQGRQIPAKQKSGRSSPSANQCAIFGVESVYSTKLVAGTTQRKRG